MKKQSGYGDYFMMDILDKYVASRGEPRFCKLRISDWDEFYKLSSILGNGRWIYRGHESSEWALQSGLDREEVSKQMAADHYYDSDARWDHFPEKMRPFFSGTAYAMLTIGAQLPCEKVAVENFRKLTRGKLNCGDRLIENLAAMQHYGAKTRLLDFTYSIFVALYFAFERRFTNATRTIWCIDLSRLLDNFKLDTIRGRVQKSPLSIDEGMQRDLKYKNIKRKIADLSYVYDQLLDSADANIRNETKNLGIIPIHLLGNNPRMDAQNGLFLMPCNFQPFAHNLEKALGVKSIEPCVGFDLGSVEKMHDAVLVRDTVVLKIDFDSSMERNAWSILHAANITPRTIYPDMDGIAKSIRYEAQ